MEDWMRSELVRLCAEADVHSHDKTLNAEIMNRIMAMRLAKALSSGKRPHK